MDHTELVGMPFDRLEFLSSAMKFVRRPRCFHYWISAVTHALSLSLSTEDFGQKVGHALNQLDRLCSRRTRVRRSFFITALF